MKIIDMRKGEWNKTKAFFSLETDEGIIIKGFKLVDGKKGLFMSMPSTYNKRDEKWYDDIRMPEELRDNLQEKAIREYGGGGLKNDNTDPYPF